ncbi:MAG: 2OG-Fe(II) oxygenase [Chloroflexi bacterium]|nr:2OG-Fe(II) oxygenase [Chloroflexota bacterium]
MGTAVKSALDLHSLSKVTMNREPSQWGSYYGVFNPRVLEAKFPEDHFSYHSQRRILEAICKRGTDAWYQHNVRTRPLLELGSKDPFEPDTLDPLWLCVADDLSSRDYRECLSETVRHNVRDLKMQAHFWEFGEGSFFQPHVDKTHKIVTHLMYLTKGWTEGKGGCLQLLGSKNSADIRRTFPPTANFGVLLKREPHAWHSVSKIPIGIDSPRLVLQAWFWGSDYV